MKPLYIFDLDGTLALLQHRRHFVERPPCPFCSWVKACDHDTPIERQRGDLIGARPPFEPDWQAFYAACDLDEPNQPVIHTMEYLRGCGAQVLIFSGRSDEVRDKTVAWLRRFTSFKLHELDHGLVMRRAGDFTPDDVLKRAWFDSMLLEDRARLVATFDDRDRVVAMWRAAGITCFQVAPGEF